MRSIATAEPATAPPIHKTCQRIKMRVPVSTRVVSVDAALASDRRRVGVQEVPRAHRGIPRIGDLAGHRRPSAGVGIVGWSGSDMSWSTRRQHGASLPKRPTTVAAACSTHHLAAAHHLTAAVAAVATEAAAAGTSRSVATTAATAALANARCAAARIGGEIVMLAATTNRHQGQCHQT